MKKITIIALLLFSLPLFAQVTSKKDLVKMTIDRAFPDGEHLDTSVDLSDLIEKWNLVFDKQHLERDRNKHRMDWRSLFPIENEKVHSIKGTRVFYGISEREYRYDILQDPSSNKLIVNLRIHFTPSKTYLRRMKRLKSKNDPDQKYYPEVDELMEKVSENLALAEDIWNRQAPEGVEFKFERVEAKTDAHYAIKLVTKMGALYDRFIVAPAYPDILAHEIGHMLGLDDEYSVVTSNLLPIHSLVDAISSRHPERHNDHSSYKDMRCNLESIMCLKEKVYPYHFDHILGRIQHAN